MEIDVDMNGLKVFFDAYKYLSNCVKESLKGLDREKLKAIFAILIEARNAGASIIVDGQGRSLESILLAEECLEHNGFPIILPTKNANLRPWKKGDVFIVNTGSGTGSPLTHAEAAQKDGLHVIFMSYNAKLPETFPNTLVLEGSKNRNSLFAPLGTEFELTSAVTGVCVGHSVASTPEESLKAFEVAVQEILKLYEKSYEFYEKSMDNLKAFTDLISSYIPTNSGHKVYFRGVGGDEIVNNVAAIRYGHLHKEPNKDLRVIYEGHWELRTDGDLAILTSGSGSTDQTLDYAMQAFISGMKIFGITSFEDSDLGRFCKRVNGCLIVPGRQEAYSMYNRPTRLRSNFLPLFELNCYLTLDSLLAQIASDHGISEDDMKRSHRPKVLE
ncbi:MAG: hypothetical protein RBG13Loki_1994 [Promethearchaeota archaeon CR_4]|nr:MAG: hypothetical protein RBG13Loki_1994 [Candidatus Lokiarchaeota archaeon CR_4]